MSFWRKYTVIAPVGLSIVLLAGCNDSKVAQCQRLIDAVNEGNSLIDKNKAQQVITSSQLSKDLQAATKKIQELNLKDPKLKDYQNRFVKAFQTLSQSVAKAARGLSSAKAAQASATGRVQIQKSRGDIDTALTAAKTAAKQSDALATQLNKHCSEPE